MTEQADRDELARFDSVIAILRKHMSMSPHGHLGQLSDLANAAADISVMVQSAVYAARTEALQAGLGVTIERDLYRAENMTLKASLASWNMDYIPKAAEANRAREAKLADAERRIENQRKLIESLTARLETANGQVESLAAVKADAIQLTKAVEAYLSKLGASSGESK